MTDSRLTVLAPLRIEASAIRRARSGAVVIRTGVGPERAADAAAHLDGSGPLAVMGVCGGLVPELAAGDVVVASEVRGPDGTTACPGAGIVAAALRRLGLPVHIGPIAGVPEIVNGAGREALAATGALAADMESAWLAPAAAGRPFAVVRAVADTAGAESMARGGVRALQTLRRAAPALVDWAGACRRRRVVLAAPRSFCAGVDRAIEILDRVLERFGPPVYVRKQIVHNAHVVREFEAKGAVFVDELDEVPRHSRVVFSAHGVSPAVRRQAETMSLEVVDATCPLVTKVHREAARFARKGYDVVLVGHDGHEEPEGVIGEAPEAVHLLDPAAPIGGLEVSDPSRVAFLTQTTLALDETDDAVERLRSRFPNLVGPRSQDICYASQNRQDAVRAVAADVDAVLVVGSGNSSNSNRLVDVARRTGVPAHLVDDASELDPVWLADVGSLGLTAGASAPEGLVVRLIEALASLGELDVVEHRVTTEDTRFNLPLEVRT